MMSQSVYERIDNERGNKTKNILFYPVKRPKMVFPLYQTVSYVSSICIQWQGMRCGTWVSPSPPMVHSFLRKTCNLQFRLSPYCSNECPARISQAFHEHISKIKESTYLKTLMGVSAYKKK